MLEQFTEEEFLAGMDEIKQGQGRELHEFFPELEKLIAGAKRGQG